MTRTLAIASVTLMLMLMHARPLVAILCILALGCGAEDTSPDPSPAQPAEAPPPPREETTAYEIHEWGLVDVDLSTRRMELAAGPGRVEAATAPSAPGPTPPRPGLGLGDIGSARKPVIYVHLRDASQDLRFDLTVHLGALGLAEHWPAGAASEHRVRWENIGVRRGHCAGGPYPSAADPICATSTDGYCEAAELVGYVAEDADCMSVGGTDRSLLFYRGEGPMPALPVELERMADGTVTLTNARIAEPVGPALRLRRASDGSIHVAEVPFPPRGASVAIPPPTEHASDARRDTVRRALSALGMTAAESAAFERAWFGELFDGAAPTPHGFSDALFFFLPESDVDAYARIEAEPAPAAVRRAMAMRVGWPE